MLRLRKDSSPIAILASGRQRQPAAGLEQRPLADPQPALVERLEQLALDRVADEEAAPRAVAVDPPAAQAAMVALIPAALHPPQPPTSRTGHRTLQAPDRVGSQIAEEGKRASNRLRRMSGPARRHRPRRDQDPDGGDRRQGQGAGRSAAPDPDRGRAEGRRRRDGRGDARGRRGGRGRDRATWRASASALPATRTRRPASSPAPGTCPAGKGASRSAKTLKEDARHRGQDRQRRPGRDRSGVPPRRRARVLRACSASSGGPASAAG